MKLGKLLRGFSIILGLQGDLEKEQTQRNWAKGMMKKTTLD
jgi:hypothetical protein